jgi:RimJ/RimL family protein N-acetyltransferase
MVTAPLCLETTRFRLERISPEHREFLVRIHADPRVAATLWPGSLGGVRAPEQVEEFLARSMLAWQRNGTGTYVVRDRWSGEPVGRVALNACVVEGRPEWELGWVTDPEAWGQGVATEAAGALVPVAFDEFGFDHVVAFTLPWNRASQRVMAKLGMRKVRGFVHANLPHILYRLDR